MADGIPTPEEVDEARKACGPVAPMGVLMGWVMGQRRAAWTSDASDAIKNLVDLAKEAK